MKCQILFSGKNKKSIIRLSSAEFTQRAVKVKITNAKALLQVSLAIENILHVNKNKISKLNKNKIR